MYFAERWVKRFYWRLISTFKADGYYLPSFVQGRNAFSESRLRKQVSQKPSLTAVAAICPLFLYRIEMLEEQKQNLVTE